ncbi:MAG: DUF4168 domain-containing protein [Cyanobacteria bacterium P01_D01_bin.1]
MTLPQLRFHQLRFRQRWFALALGTLTLAQIGFLLTQKHIPAAYAQAYGDEEVTNYARSVVNIEAERVESYALAGDVLASADSELSIVETPLNCASTRLADMPDVSRESRVDLRAVLVAFCNNAIQIAEENDLTPKVFNEITAAHREDAELSERIRDAIASL